MIIDSKGNILTMWNRADGPAVYDANFELMIDFHVCIPYTDSQKAAYREIFELKKKLAATDYKAIKYAEGLISEAEYEEIKTARSKWRERINELEFEEPVLSRKEMDEAELIAVAKLKEREAKHGTD